MKLINLYEELIAELQNISQEARTWSYVLTNLLNTTQHDPKLGWNKLAITKNLVVYGKKYPEAYNLFPVDVFNITRVEGNGGGV